MTTPPVKERNDAAPCAASVSLNVLRLFRQGHARASELDALARKRRVNPARRELAHLRSVDRLAPAVHTVAAREEFRVAGLHRLRVDAHAALRVKLDAFDRRQEFLHL